MGNQILPALLALNRASRDVGNAYTATEPNTPAIGKGLAAGKLASEGLKGAGYLGGSDTLSGLGSGLGKAAGVAGAGYNFYRGITDPTLSKSQKVGHTGRGVADAVMSYAIPYYGAAKAVQAVGQQLEKSGSPQVAGLGTSLDYAVEPAGAKAFWSVVEGDKSPKAAMKNAPQELVLDLLGPLGTAARGAGISNKVAKGVMDYGPIPGGGKMLKTFGIGSPPTKGTQYRDALGKVFSKEKIPIKDMKAYNIDPAKFNSFDPNARSAATKLGQMFTKGYKTNPEAYSIQAQNLLMNNMAPDQILALAKKYGV